MAKLRDNDVLPSLKKQFGENLRSIRLALRMTQDEFSEHLGISADFLSLVERGVNAPSFDKIENIAATLKLKPFQLFLFQEDPPPPKARRMRKPG